MKKALKAYSDSELLEMFGKGKEEADQAFRFIYDRYAPRLHAYCLRILNNREQAEDIFQETFVRFYQNAGTNKNKGTISGFLITIARNLCLNYKRDRKSSVPFNEFHSIISDAQSDNKEEKFKLITMALELLSFEYKEPFVLRLYDGLSYEDIGDICGISPENARKRVFRAKMKIKDILQPYIKEMYG